MKKFLLLSIFISITQSCTIESISNEIKEENHQLQKEDENTSQQNYEVDPIKVKPPTGG